MRALVTDRRVPRHVWWGLGVYLVLHWRSGPFDELIAAGCMVELMVRCGEVFRAIREETR